MPRLHIAVLAALALSGCSALASLGSRSGTELRVSSYNIRHGRGMDNRVALERTAGVLRGINPDIVGLQEVDRNVERSGRVDEAALLGNLLGMQHAFGAFMDYQGGRYGLAILSRHPIVSSREIVLPTGEEPRVALAARIVVPGGDTITAINVHFDWVENDAARYRQARALSTVLDTLSDPWLLVGDFNDGPDSRTLRVFQDMVHAAPKPTDSSFTFPSNAPVKEIDYIFAQRSERWRSGTVRVVVDSLASDHRPVSTSIRYVPATIGRPRD
jgi:endonuclease/exonuclease/phosphatase family metal-dependent hydrolase